MKFDLTLSNSTKFVPFAFAILTTILSIYLTIDNTLVLRLLIPILVLISSFLIILWIGELYTYEPPFLDHKKYFRDYWEDNWGYRRDYKRYYSFRDVSEYYLRETQFGLANIIDIDRAKYVISDIPRFKNIILVKAFARFLIVAFIYATLFSVLPIEYQRSSQFLTFIIFIYLISELVTISYLFSQLNKTCEILKIDLSAITAMEQEIEKDFKIILTAMGKPLSRFKEDEWVRKDKELQEILTDKELNELLKEFNKIKKYLKEGRYKYAKEFAIETYKNYRVDALLQLFTNRNR